MTKINIIAQIWTDKFYLTATNYNPVFPPLALSIFCRFYGTSITKYASKNIPQHGQTGLSHMYILF